MTEPMIQTEKEVSEVVESAVRHSGGIHALRAIRKLVDAENEEERAKKKAVKWVVISLFVFLIALLLWGNSLNPLPQNNKSTVLAYVDIVSRHIELSANANYPTELRLKNIHGTVVLHMTFMANGKLDRIDIRNSSGNPFLDSVAIRMVQMASPFPPFSEELKKQIDIMDITKSFVFADENVTLQ